VFEGITGGQGTVVVEGGTKGTGLFCHKGRDWGSDAKWKAGRTGAKAATVALGEAGALSELDLSVVTPSWLTRLAGSELVLKVVDLVSSVEGASTLAKFDVCRGRGVVEGRVTVGVSMLSMIGSALFVLNSREVVFLCRSFLMPTCWLWRVSVIVRLALGCATVPSNLSTSCEGGSETGSRLWSTFSVITTVSFNFPVVVVCGSRSKGRPPSLGDSLG
jgi:hypothetical protein